MFTVFPLNSDLNTEVQNLQKDWEVDRVETLGKDANFTTYVLVEYNIKPGQPVSGSGGDIDTPMSGSDFSAKKPKGK